MNRSAIVILSIVTLISASTSVLARSEVCRPTSDKEIAALFDRWNASLQTGDPKKVVDNYATKSILLPTVSNKPRLTPGEKEDYFEHFLEPREVHRRPHDDPLERGAILLHHLDAADLPGRANPGGNQGGTNQCGDEKCQTVLA